MHIKVITEAHEILDIMERSFRDPSVLLECQVGETSHDRKKNLCSHLETLGGSKTSPSVIRACFIELLLMSTAWRIKKR